MSDQGPNLWSAMKFSGVTLSPSEFFIHSILQYSQYSPLPIAWGWCACLPHWVMRILVMPLRKTMTLLWVCRQPLPASSSLALNLVGSVGGSVPLTMLFLRDCLGYLQAHTQKFFFKKGIQSERKGRTPSNYFNQSMRPFASFLFMLKFGDFMLNISIFSIKLDLQTLHMFQ